MGRPTLELADLFKNYGHLLGTLIPNQYKVVNAIKNCRTGALGGHVLKCNSCGHKRNAYNSCRNRHCPKCQFQVKLKWIENRKADLLPCEYFHVVFTIPQELRRVFLQNKELCYNLLFKASSETLKEVAKNPKNLGAEIGFIGILHTWGQNLIDHPHVHYVIPAGGLSDHNDKWIKSRDNYFLSVKVLSQVFRAKLIKKLQEVYDQNKLTLLGSIEHLSAPQLFDDLLNSLAAKEWIVYAKKPFAGPEQVIDYLGQYTHRIAISNHRLVSTEAEKVLFKARDNNNPEKHKIVTLPIKEFLRRFLLHVLPRGFVRIRHFGLLGNRMRKEKIRIIRELEGIIESLEPKKLLDWRELLEKVMGIELNLCPSCKEGEMIAVAGIRDAWNTT